MRAQDLSVPAWGLGDGAASPWVLLRTVARFVGLWPAELPPQDLGLPRMVGGGHDGLYVIPRLLSLVLRQRAGVSKDLSGSRSLAAGVPASHAGRGSRPLGSLLGQTPGRAWGCGGPCKEL